MRTATALLSVALLVAGVSTAVYLHSTQAGGPQTAETVGGPLAHLLTASTDLGPSQASDAQLTAELADTGRPDDLMHWLSLIHI